MEFWKLFFLGERQMTYLGEGFAWVTMGRRKIYRLTIKKTSCKRVVKDFPYSLRVPSTDCFAQKMHIPQELAFLKN